MSGSAVRFVKAFIAKLSPPMSEAAKSKGRVPGDHWDGVGRLVSCAGGVLVT